MVHQSEDQLFKYATKEDGFGLLKLLKESNANIKEIDFKSENLTYNPTELIELDPKIYKTDMILELDHLIVLTEFQSTIVKTIDEKRYRLYTALVDYAKRNNKPLILIVISTAEKTKIKQYKINKDCVFTIPIVSLKDFDGDKIINNIENKIKNIINIEKEKIKNKYNSEKYIEELFLNNNIENIYEKEIKILNENKLQLHKLEIEKNNMEEKLNNLILIDEKINYLDEQYKELMQKNESMEYAKNILEKAYIEMKQNITPKFIKNLSEIIKEISDNKYEEIKFNNEDGLIVEKENGEYVSVDKLSVGTIDQLYLAFRLSIIKEISEEKSKKSCKRRVETDDSYVKKCIE